MSSPTARGKIVAHLSNFEFFARFTDSARTNPSWVSGGRIGPLRIKDKFKMLSTTSRLQAVAKEVPCRD